MENERSGTVIVTGEAAVHHMLWLRDVLSAAARHADGIPSFLFGDPPRTLRCLRVQGIIVEEVDWPADTSCRHYKIDDGTGVLRVRLARDRLSFHGLVPFVGALVDFLGTVGEETHPDGTVERRLDAYGFDVKEDPMADVLRALELLHLYHNVYFSRIERQAPAASVSTHIHPSSSPVDLRTSASPPSPPQPPSQSIRAPVLAVEAWIVNAGDKGASEAELIRQLPELSPQQICEALETLAVHGVIFEQAGSFRLL